MKRVTTLLLAACLTWPAMAHDCDCDCENKTDTDAQASEPASEETGKSVEDKAVKEEVKEDKNTLQKFLDHPPASDAAKKRMKRK